MSFGGLLFIFISVGGVLSSLLPLKLDLDVTDEANFKIECAYLDNVFYTHFTPKSNKYVKRVDQSNSKIWESAGYGRCVYALLAMDRFAPSLLYLKVDNGYSVEHKYYKKQSGQWVESDICEYEKLVDELGKSVKLQKQFTLDVFQPVGDKYYTIQYSTKETPYTYIAPKVGYFATAVKYLKETLWKAQKYGDRCVAVWAYLNEGKYYMLRLLVTRHTQESEILTFLLKDEMWELVDSMNKTHTNKYAQKPSNFMYPNYKFGFAGACSSDKDLGPQNIDRAGNVASTLNKESTPGAPEEDKSEYSPLDVPKESYFDITGDYYKFNVHDGDDVDDESLSSKSVNTEKEVDKSQLLTEISDSKVLHLSNPTARRIGVDLRYVDNVLYKIYRIGRNNAPAKVVDASGTVWSARTLAERCVYLMSAQSRGSSYALYLIIEVGCELTAAYFVKEKEGWAKTSLEHYKTVIESLKNPAIKYKVGVDISKKVQNVNASVTYNDGKSPNYMFLPKNGYFWDSIMYKDVTIWQAADDERCVALWSHEFFGKPYYVRLVTTDASGQSDMISYLNANGSWELLTSFNESAAHHLSYSSPSNFFNPEYEFNQLPDYGTKALNKKGFEARGVFTDDKTLPVVNENKESSESTTAPADSATGSKRKRSVSFKGAYREPKRFKKSESVTDIVSPVKAPETTEAKVDSVSEASSTSVVNRRETTLGEYRPAPRTFDPNKLLTIDLVPDLSKIGDRMYTVFDNKLKLVSYHAPAGYYFNLVTQANNQLFWGTVDTTLCYAVNMYLKDDQYYLCDLLLRSRDRDMSMYFKLDDDVWVSIPKRDYMDDLEELRSTMLKL
ncbi:hypothetical protein MACJ_002941 [Theileria orientalis]|uniref:Uncharacterized protein n=1 Tax=Theileria orientalis TaxID=68886 RepID=A0A976M8G4_THEOR|nr:hypothetical protein MACJ_002941 [Theileria orientalis]